MIKRRKFELKQTFNVGFIEKLIFECLSIRKFVKGNNANTIEVTDDFKPIQLQIIFKDKEKILNKCSLILI